jgi:glycosyltransferase involved in cell wall biosynthesis
VRILLVSSMYPGPDDPDFGTFVKATADELERQGHEVARAVVHRRRGSLAKQARLAAAAVGTARRFRPDVVYAHYLLPAGAAAALAARVARVPYVVTAHGRDVRNIGSVRGVRAVTRRVVGRAGAIVAVSDYLRRELVARLPELDGRVEVISSGVDLERFRGRDAEEARRALGWEAEPPFFLCAGTLDERKNVVRLAEAFERLGCGSLAFVGDGPLRPRLEGRPRVRLAGRRPHAEIPDWMAACDVLCQPSLVEPFGQTLLEAMASERPVVATTVGGPPEFVPAEAGALVDPLSVDAIEAGLRSAAELPRPSAAARAAAAEHDLRKQAERVGELLERVVRGAREQSAR